MDSAAPTPTDPTGLTVLGNTVRHAIDHVEVFPAPAHVTTVRSTTDERPCHAAARHRTRGHRVHARRVWCIESKSLKVYLWGFRDRAVFAEALTAEIANQVMTTAQPKDVTVTLTQRPRGGIEVQAVARLHR